MDLNRDSFAFEYFAKANMGGGLNLIISPLIFFGALILGVLFIQVLIYLFIPELTRRGGITSKKSQIIFYCFEFVVGLIPFLYVGSATGWSILSG